MSNCAKFESLRVTSLGAVNDGEGDLLAGDRGRLGGIGGTGAGLKSASDGATAGEKSGLRIYIDADPEGAGTGRKGNGWQTAAG